MNLGVRCLQSDSEENGGRIAVMRNEPRIAAGQKAVLRGLDAARSAMDREGEFGFDARALLRNEARLQADLRVASLPDELDPFERRENQRSDCGAGFTLN